MLVSLKLPVRTISAFRPTGLSAVEYEGPRTSLDRIDLAFLLIVFER